MEHPRSFFITGGKKESSCVSRERAIQRKGRETAGSPWVRWRVRAGLGERKLFTPITKEGPTPKSEEKTIRG